jgi:hypothetical protein
MVSAVMLFACVTASSEAAEFTFFETDGTTVTAVLQLTAAESLTNDVYCFRLAHNGNTIGPIVVDGGSPGSGCRPASLSGVSQSFVVTVTPAFAIIGTVTAEARRNGVLVATRTLEPQPPPPLNSLRVRATVNSEPMEGAGVALPANARVPLGAVVRFEALNQDGAPISASFSLGSASLEAGIVARYAIFPQHALITYLAPGPNEGLFQAVHRGQVSLTIHPDDPNVAAGTITITVENPLRLGSQGNQFDSAIYEMAHATGVPPQFIKAHADKESYPKFNGLSYRYEPIAAPFVSDLDAISTPPVNLRTVAPYSNYRLATRPDANNPGLPSGSILTTADRDVRQSLLVGCDANGANGVPIGIVELDGAHNPTALEIFRCTDIALGKGWARVAGVHAGNRIRRLKANPFTAQTSLAASYGLLQMTPRKAIGDRLWPDTQPRNPSLLFDTASNHAQGGGSLLFGTRAISLKVL